MGIGSHDYNPTIHLQHAGDPGKQCCKPVWIQISENQLGADGVSPESKKARASSSDVLGQKKKWVSQLRRETLLFHIFFHLGP
jgi:hypothetical protein